MIFVVKVWNNGIKWIFVRYNGWFYGMELVFFICKCLGVF